MQQEEKARRLETMKLMKEQKKKQGEISVVHINLILGQ